MKYWILVALLSGLFTLVMHFAAPEMLGSTAYYAGVAVCALIALVITWRDPPGMFDKVLFFLFKWGGWLRGWYFLSGGQDTSWHSGESIIRMNCLAALPTP